MEPGLAPSQVDTSRAHPARMYDFYLGGTSNYPVDREAASEVIARAPETRDVAWANRAFLGRAVRFLAEERGIRQFLDIGTGIPSPGSVPAVTAKAAPGAHVVCVDNDPIVNIYADALLAGPATTGIVLADLRDPKAILSHPVTRELLDFTRPIALMLIAIAHFITDDERPAEIVATLRDVLPAGSYLALSHVTSDFRPQSAAGLADVYQQATSTVTPRTHQQVSALFTGWDLEDPGLVQAPLWRPDTRPPRNLDKIWVYGGVGRLRR
jgi:hypothetical protein